MLASMSALTLAQANQVVGAALSEARRLAYRPMAVVLLDDSGNLRALQRENGATPFRVEIAKAKAFAAYTMSASSRVVGERAQANPTFFTSLAAVAQGRFLAATGAVLIKDRDGQILGAVGASGGTGDEDETICIAGVLASGLQWG